MIFQILVVVVALFGRCGALLLVPSTNFPEEFASLSTTRLWKKFRIKINSPHMPYAHKPSELAKLGEKIALAEKILDELAYRASTRTANDTNSSQHERQQAFTQRLSDFNVRIHMLEQNSQAISAQRGHYKFASWLDLSARERTPLKGAVDLPLVTYLATEYIETRILQFRSLLLKCLDLGADPTAVSPWTINNAPIPWYLTLRIPLDVELAARVVQAGASLQAWYRLDEETHDATTNQNEQDTATTVTTLSQHHHQQQQKIPSTISGVSFLQALCQDFEQRTVVRRILSVVDEYFFMMRTHPGLYSAADGTASLKVAFAWLSETPLLKGKICRNSSAGSSICRKDMAWQGHPLHVVYRNLMRYSETFRRFEEDWQKSWRKELPRRISHSIAEDLKIALLQTIVNSSSSYDVAFEAGVQFFPNNVTAKPNENPVRAAGGWNFFHLCAIRRTSRLLQFVLNAIHLHTDNPTLERHGVRNVSNAALAVRALSSRLLPLGRNALHVAAVNRDDSTRAGADCFSILASFCEVVFATGLVSGMTNPLLARDFMGKTPSDYLRKLPKVNPSATPLAERTRRHSTRQASTQKQQGNWPRTKFARKELVVALDPTRCDIDEHYLSGPIEGERLSQLLLENRPFVLRASDSYLYDTGSSMGSSQEDSSTEQPPPLPFRRELLRKGLFEKKFGASTIEVDSVPYGSAHRSIFSGQNEGVQDGLSHDSSKFPNASNEVVQTTISEYIRSFVSADSLQRCNKIDEGSPQCEVSSSGDDDDPSSRDILDDDDDEKGTGKFRCPPRYMFSSTFVNRNPDIHAVSAAALEMLRNLSVVYAVKEMQFFLGPAGSGAPVHWHPAALNFLAFGEKLWFLTAPLAKSAAYSNEPVSQWMQQPRTKLLLDQLPSQGGDVLQCTQQPGDIVFVPNQWTHATLNTMTSIGVAHEILFSEDYLSHPCSVEEDGQAAQTSAETGMCQNVWARLGNEIAKSRRSWQSHDGRKVADGGGGGGGGDESSSKPSGTSSHSEDEDVDFDHRVKWGRQYAHVYPGYNIAKWRRQFPEFAQIWEQHSVASASTTEHTGKRFTRQQKSSASSTLSSSDEKRRRHSRGNNKPNVVESASSPPSSSFQSASQASSTPLEPTKKKAEIYRRVLGNKNRQQRRR